MYLTIDIQHEKHLQEKTTVSERQDNYRNNWTDHWGDLCDGSQEEPNQTLSHGKHISDQRRRDAALPTCFQRSCPKPDIMPLRLKRSRPTSIVRSKTTSETSVAIAFWLLVSVFSTPQTLCSGTHAERSCRLLVSKLPNPDLRERMGTPTSVTPTGSLAFQMNKWCEA